MMALACMSERHVLIRHITPLIWSEGALVHVHDTTPIQCLSRVDWVQTWTL